MTDWLGNTQSSYVILIWITNLLNRSKQFNHGYILTVIENDHKCLIFKKANSSHFTIFRVASAATKKKDHTKISQENHKKDYDAWVLFWWLSNTFIITFRKQSQSFFCEVSTGKGKMQINLQKIFLKVPIFMFTRRQSPKWKRRKDLTWKTPTLTHENDFHQQSRFP